MYITLYYIDSRYIYPATWTEKAERDRWEKYTYIYKSNKACWYVYDFWLEIQSLKFKISLSGIAF